MTKQQKIDFKKLSTKSERAKFLLNIGVKSKINVVDLTFVSQACVGDVYLPVYADNDKDAIAKGTQWLQRIADNV